MEKFCQNPLCESPSFKKVPVSVKKPSDQVRALCAPCEEAYTWGVQHGRKTAESGKLWLLAVADRGIIAHVQAYSSKTDAEKGLVKYLRQYHGYKGPAKAEAVQHWLQEHDEYLSVEVIEQCVPIHVTSPDHSETTLLNHLGSFLGKGGFAVLARNRQDPHPPADIEAWAYQGPLDFKSAKPVTFGLGKDYRHALQALDSQLARLHNKPQP